MRDGTSQRIPLSVFERRRLEALMSAMGAAHKASARERKHLGKIEFESQDGDWSMLGTAEIRSDTVAGIVLGWLKRGVSDPDSAADKLESWSLADSPDGLDSFVERWRAANSEKFEAFNKYLDAIESVRVAALTVAKGK